MKQLISSLAPALVLIGSLASAQANAGVDGSWAADVPIPNGQRGIAVTFTFHVDGSTLGGTVSTNGSTFDLVNTRVDGNRISFMIDGESERFTGSVDGDDIKMQVTYTSSENGTRTWSFVAKRVKTDARIEAPRLDGSRPER
jgi:hypothetical protein